MNPSLRQKPPVAAESGGDLRLLLIEDNPGDAGLIKEMLVDDQVSFSLEWVTDLKEGIARLHQVSFDLVLLDLTLPDSSGLETFERLRERAPLMPIVVLSGLSDENLAVHAVHAGAQDYLVKGAVDERLLSRSIRYAIERKRVEVAMQESNARLREAQSIAHLGSWEWVPGESTVRWSEELFRIYGMEPQADSLGFEDYLDRVHPDDRLRVRRSIEEALRDRKEFSFEERILRPDGSVRVLWTQGRPAVSDAGEVAGLFAACLDVTDRKRAELDLAAARDAALQSVRLKSAFIANMSHEIRTPLNIILGYTEVISTDFDGIDEASRSRLTDGIRRAGARLMTTIDGILDISRMETGNFEVNPVSIDLTTLIQTKVGELQGLASEKALSLRFENEVPGAKIFFDEYCLSHALTNLLQNAIKFTPEGSVSVRVARDAEGFLFVEVTDTGIGIEREYLSRLFEPFSQEESGYTRQFEGSGLGLALTRHYLERNDATIEVDSAKGQGTIFRIRFSKDAEAAEELVTGRDPARLGQGGASGESPRPSVVVVEDDADTQAYLKIILERTYDVRLAASGDELRRILEKGAAPDVVLMDLSLSGAEDGIVLTRYLRSLERFRDVPVIVTTAHAFPEDHSRALDAGCDAYLAKPIDRRQLLTTMEDLCRSRSTAATPN